MDVNIDIRLNTIEVNDLLVEEQVEDAQSKFRSLFRKQVN